MKLYYSKGACSLAPRIIINELGLPASFEAVDLKTKRTESGEDFLQINPKGCVPTLVTDTGDILTENAIILQYLADKGKANDLLPPLSDFKRYKVLEWLNFVATELHKSVGALFKPDLPEDAKDKFFLPLIKSRFSFLNRHLKDHQFLLGEKFTLPDAYLLVVLNWLAYFKISMEDWPNVTRYYRDLKNKKSIQKAFQDEGLVSATA